MINRGNYRAVIFASDGAREAFEKCLWEACDKTGWRVHAYAIMRNHYHLALKEVFSPAKSRTPALQHAEYLYPPRVHPKTSFWALAVSSDTTGWVIFRSAVIAKNWAQQSFAGPMASRP